MIGILGAGAFGTALAVTLGAEGRRVRLWLRDAGEADRIARTRQNDRRLPGVTLPESVSVTGEIAALAGDEVLLLALPAQSLAAFLAEHRSQLNGATLVACCKGVDLATRRGPTALIAAACPDSASAVLTGPSFAADIAAGKPTALTLATTSGKGEALQRLLSTPTLRLYRTDDVTGAELGGALKNVIAIAAGVVIGAGLGDSARAALMTRGYAEMVRLALHFGAQAETLAGLSGLGDLVLTCTSVQSRNFSHGRALGAGTSPDPATTVEGVATARATRAIAAAAGIDMPITGMVAALVAGEVTVQSAIQTLLSRPLKPE
jgi:glycerol-3-phosphate dehydrogenase (NAD(P)+)